MYQESGVDTTFGNTPRIVRDVDIMLYAGKWYACYCTGGVATTSAGALITTSAGVGIPALGPTVAGGGYVSDDSFNVATSADLINWSLLVTPQTEPAIDSDANWAPSWFVDQNAYPHVFCYCPGYGTYGISEREEHPNDPTAISGWSNPSNWSSNGGETGLQAGDTTVYYFGWYRL